MIQSVLSNIETSARSLTNNLNDHVLLQVIHKISFAALSLVAHVFEWIDYAITGHKHDLSKTLFYSLFTTSLQQVRMKLLINGSQDRSEFFSEVQFRKIWGKLINDSDVIPDFASVSLPFLKLDEGIILNKEARIDIKRSVFYLKSKDQDVIHEFGSNSQIDIDATILQFTSKLAAILKKPSCDCKVKTLSSFILNNIHQATAAIPTCAVTVHSLKRPLRAMDYYYNITNPMDQTLRFEMILGLVPWTIIEEKGETITKYFSQNFETKLQFDVDCNDSNLYVSNASYVVTKKPFTHKE